MLNERRELRRLARRLKRERPVPTAALSRLLSEQIAPGPRWRGFGDVLQLVERRRPLFAVSLSAAVLLGLALVGGVSYAANSITHAARAAAHIVAPQAKHGVVAVSGLTAGGDQYRPGYGFGDENHSHDGPPGLTGKGGEKTPPAQTRTLGDKEKVVTRIRVDEQAALYISVLDADGNRLVLSQEGSKVGTGLSGKPVKTIHYVVLVPRSIPIQLLVPKNLLVKGETYRIHLIAVDPDGNKTVSDIPFVA